MANYEINDTTREPLIEWLKDRSQFSVWFTSLITASFVVFSVFGNKPGFDTLPETVLSISLILLLFAMVCNFVTVWAIPGWKLKIMIGAAKSSRRMYYELSINTWLGVLSFIAGLTLGFIASVSMGLPDPSSIIGPP